jgi:prevent-host-death family protein
MTCNYSVGGTGSPERTTRDVREHLADVVNDAIQGRVTYITSNGRRVAAVVPLAVADAPAGTRPVKEMAI